MPQLNPEFYFSQLFWLLITFSFLLIFLWRISLPRISTVLEKRDNKINNDIETAKQQQAEAEEIQHQIEKQLLDARNQGSSLIKESKEKMQKITIQELKKVDDELNKKLNEASLIVENNKKKSLDTINDQIHEITKMLLSKLSSVNVTDNEIKTSISNISQNKIN